MGIAGLSASHYVRRVALAASNDSSRLHRINYFIIQEDSIWEIDVFTAEELFFRSIFVCSSTLRPRTDSTVALDLKKNHKNPKFFFVFC